LEGTDPTIEITPDLPVKSVRIDDVIPCVAVIDEDSSLSPAEAVALWDQFRDEYSTRPFCLLIPNPESASTNVDIPGKFKSDSNTVYHYDVARDDGDVSKADDWFELCQLSKYDTVGRVGVFIDDSGSLDEEEVQASRDLFGERLQTLGIQVAEVVNKDENWILPFLTSLASGPACTTSAGGTGLCLSRCAGGVTFPSSTCTALVPGSQCCVIGRPAYEEKKLVPLDGRSSDQFGFSVALTDQYAVVGAPYDDDNGSSSGSAYLFNRTGADWSESFKFVPLDGDTSDHSGRAVAIGIGGYSFETVLVGSPRDDDKGSSSGSVYVLKRDGDHVWYLDEKLTAPDGAENDEFGYAIAVSGNFAVIGAPDADYPSSNTGSAYVFADSSATWDQGTKLPQSDPGVGDNFGEAVAIDGDYIFVGAPFDDDLGSNSGSVHTFKRDSSGVWQETGKITAGAQGSSGDRFGSALDISGRYALVGAPYDDDITSNAGAVHAFQLDSDDKTWAYVKKLTPADSDSGFFGSSVALEGSAAVIGTRDDDERALYAGASYIFRRDVNGDWDDGTKIFAYDSQSGDRFGNSVAISENYAVAGSKQGDNDNGSDSGSAYVFPLSNVLRP